MANIRRTTAERIADTQMKIDQYEAQMKALLQTQKQQERKERTRRLIERGAILESLIDEAASFTNEQIKTVLTAALNTNIALDKLTALRGQTAAAAPQGGEASEPKTAEKPPNGDIGTAQTGDNGAGQAG